MGEVGTLTLNALVGGLTAGVPQLWRRDGGRGLPGAFARGALGGSVGYAGKRLAVERWPGAGLLGRQVGAVGVSMVANAAEGRGLASQLVLPAGPVRVYARRSGGWSVHAKLDLAAAASMAWASTRPATRLDVGKSLSAGAPVFFTESEHEWFSPEGHHTTGVMRVEAPAGDWERQIESTATILAHERVHVLQHDFALQAVGAPAQRWLLGQLPGGRLLDRYVDLGLHALPWAGLNEAVSYDARPWEREAYFLSHRPRDGQPPRPVRGGVVY